MRLKKSVVRDIFILLAMLFFIIEGSKMIRRKDSRGRVLNDGETQRTDGRYAYQYTDAFGDRKMIIVGNCCRLIKHRLESERAYRSVRRKNR